MLHRRHFWLAALLVAMLLVLSVSSALAQGGNDDKAVFGGNYTLPSGQTLYGNLTVFGGNATVEENGTVSGNVTVLGGNATIAGHVTRDVNVLGGNVKLASSAVVDGNISHIGGSVNQAPGAVVRGSSQNDGVRPPAIVPPALNLQAGPADTPLSAFARTVLRFFGAIGMGLLMALIAVVALLVIPRPTAQVATTVGKEPVLAFVVGLLSLVLTTLVGFPLLLACGLGLLVWLLALLALAFGWIAAGMWVGQRLFALVKANATSVLAEAAVGTFVITWLTWVSPWCLRFLFGLIIGSIGVGAVLLTRFGTQASHGFGGIAGRPSGSGGGSTGGGSTTWPASSATQTRRAVEGEGPAAGETAGGVVVETTAAAGAHYDMPDREVAQEGPVYVDETVPPVSPASPALPVTRAVVEPGPTAAEEAASRPRARSLEDIEAIQGIGPELADRLRAAGSTTLVALATSDPETLAGQAGVSPEVVREQDWVGQARQLLG